MFIDQFVADAIFIVLNLSLKGQVRVLECSKSVQRRRGVYAEKNPQQNQVCQFALSG